MFSKPHVMTPNTKKDTPVRCYLDFDGTLSKQEGSKTVNSALYRSLQTGSSPDYGVRPFIPHEEMTKRITEAFKKPENAAMKLTPGAKQFLERMLCNNAEVIIISRNRKEYIQAVLQAEGLSKKM